MNRAKDQENDFNSKVILEILTNIEEQISICKKIVGDLLEVNPTDLKSKAIDGDN